MKEDQAYYDRIDAYAGEITCYSPQVGFLRTYREGATWWVSSDTERFATKSQQRAAYMVECWDKWGTCPVPAYLREPIETQVRSA